MYTYVQRPGCKKVNTAMYVHTGGVSNAYSRICTARARVHGWVEQRNSVVVVFMGRQRNASCSWGGNGMRRVHGEATECVVFIGRQRNAWEPTGWVGTECVVVFIGRAWTEQAMETRPGVPQNGGNGPPMVETRVQLIRRGVAYRKTDETDLLRSKRGSC